MSRSYAAVSLALALLLPLGAGLSTVGALQAPAPEAGMPDGAFEMLPYTWPGEYTTLRKLSDLTSLDVGSEADLLRAEPPPRSPLGSTSPGLGPWLREVHRGGVGPHEVVEGPLVASHTTVVVDTNQKITGSVSYDHVTMLFTTAAAGHRTIEVLPGGSLTITNSVIKAQDGDRINYGLIQARGGLVLEDNDISQMLIFSEDADSASIDPVQHSIKNNDFTDNVYGIFTDRDNVLIQDNVFFKNSYGIWVEQPAQGLFLGAATPTVLENTFEMNEVGILAYTDQASGDADPVGLYKNNAIRANIIGVQCLSNGWTNPEDPDDTRPARFEANNIYNNWGDAVNNLRGITIIVPFVGPVSVADSACLFTGNHFGTDSLFTSSADEVTNNANNPLSLPSTPALPYPLVTITGTTTWNAGSPPPAIAGPVIVVSGGSLSISDINLNTDFTIGAAKGGRIQVNDVTVEDGNGIVMRNDNDVVDDSSFVGTQLFPPVTVFRNNATVSDSTFVGEGRDRGTGISLVAGQFTEDFVWSPDILRNTIRNLRNGVTAVTMTVTMTGNTLTDIGPPEANYPLQPLLSCGFCAVIVTLNSDDNTYERVASGYSSQLLTLDADGDTYDGGFSAFSSFQLNSITMTDTLIANFEFGMLNALESSVTITDTNFTHNGVGLLSTLVNPTISTSNFFNNYLAAMYPYTTGLNAGGEQLISSAITCTNCWSPSDESWLNLYGSSVTYTQALSINDAPRPAWAGSVRQASGAGDVLTVASGVLDGPVIARNGGEVRIDGIDLDLGGKFSIGAKGGGNSGGATGKLTVRDSVLTNGGFLAMNGTASSVRNSAFRGFGGGAALFSVLWNGPTIECNDVDMGKGFPGIVLDIPRGNEAVKFLRNRFVHSAEIGGGFGLRGDTLHNSTIQFERNAVVEGAGSGQLGGLWLIMNGTHTVQHNNFLSNANGAALNLSSRNYTAGGLVSRAPTLNLAGNYYGHSTGPSVRHGLNNERNPSGEGLRVNVHALAPQPIWTGYASAAGAFDPCIGFRSTPTSPLDFQTLSFDSALSFDPSGFDLASYSWNFNGEGSSSQANPTFKFPDGGSKSVTLTVTTAGGRSAALARTINVAHSAPVAAFASSVMDEVTAAAFSDASTHPNTPVDDPPTGWAYSWNLGGEATRTERNPTYTFLDGGSKTITLTVTDNDGQSDSESRTVTVAHVPPVADFSFAGTLETDTFQLTDASTHPNAPTDGIATRAWSCSDGFSSSAANPTHRFADGGSFTCTLTVSDNDGLSDGVTKSLAVGHVAPDADFTHGAASELQAMAFTDATTHPNAPTDAPPTGYTYAWDLGDGSTSSVRDPARDYADGGSYTVTLTATDNDGLGSSAQRTVSITHVAPVAAFAFTPVNPDPGAAVSFSDLSTHPNAGVDDIVGWAWDFGDGASSTEASPTHAFDVEGLYDVVLQVTDDDGLVSSLAVRVPVGNKPPVALFSYSPSAPDDVDPVAFTDASTDPDGTIVSWAWDFGDGSASAERHPGHQFADDGFYTVSLTVTDNQGAASTFSEVIEVRNVGPTAAFIYGPERPTVNEAITFLDASADPDGSVVAWAWDFGDGSTSDKPDPDHAYAEGGDYTVSLTVTDDDGAQSTVQQGIHICETGLDLEELRLEFCLRVEL